VSQRKTSNLLSFEFHRQDLVVCAANSTNLKHNLRPCHDKENSWVNLLIN
jgi:hypothetical protein